MEGQPLLEARGVSKSFGGVVALRDVDLAAHRGEVVGLIGPNGSGKTTLFDCLSRLQSVDTGRILLCGRDVTRLRPWQVARLGLARTFQVIRVYRKMSVLENLLVSRQWRGESLLRMLLPRPPETERRALELLDFLRLGELRHQPAGHLSGGQRRLLELGMALMPDPEVLLLDEATSGVNPALVEMLKDDIRRLHRELGKTFLLVEHDIRFISELCSRVVVLHAGRKLAEGSPEQVRADERVVEAYFGG